MNFTSEDVMYAAQECDRQRSGEMSVAWMLTGLRYARAIRIWDNLEEDTIRTLALAIEPEKNMFGFRRANVIVGGNLITHKGIAEGIAQLCEGVWTTADADEFYRHYQMIHPFIDGNGRTGSILWNAIRGTLDCPIAPPDMFGVGR